MIRFAVAVALGAMAAAFGFARFYRLDANDAAAWPLFASLLLAALAAGFFAGRLSMLAGVIALFVGPTALILVRLWAMYYEAAPTLRAAGEFALAFSVVFLVVGAAGAWIGGRLRARVVGAASRRA